MRIKTLRFRNLASLAGEWELDFTDPAFAANGLFAITGQTGAGKSTILDAICLALYGQTPRLNKIGLKSNEIMSRHHADCFAEVVFETKKGRFLCRWSQTRKGKSPTGELAPSRHILQELDVAPQDPSDTAKGPDEVRGSDRKADVLARVEELTGLDFTRFTRSMLLAQGDFAAFLNAKPAERALLLERITGTELYADISRRTSERTSAEDKALAILTAELNGLVPLTDEETATFSNRLAELTASGQDLAARQVQVQTALHWLERHTELLHGKAALVAARTTLTEQRLARAPLTQRLTLAKAALELEAAHTALAARRTSLRQAQTELTAARNRLPELEARELQTRQARQVSEAALTVALTAEREAAPVLARVRQLDTRLRERRDVLTRSEQAFAARTAALEALRREHTADAEALNRHNTERQTLLQRLTATAAHAALPGQLSGFRAEADSLKNLYARQDELRKALHAAQAEESRRDKAVESARLALENRLKATVPTETQLKADSAERTRLLEGKEPTLWRQEQQQLTEQGTRLRTISESLIAMLADQTAWSRHEAALAEQAPQRTALAEALRVDEVLVPQLEARRELLDRIRTLEGHRARLEAGQPCPLCGSEHHPYAAQTPPPPDTVLAELTTARNRLETNRKAWHRLELDQTARTTAMAQLADRLRTTCAALAEPLREVADMLPGLEPWRQADRSGTPPPTICPEHIQDVDNVLAATRERFVMVRDRADHLDALETTLRTLEATLETGREAVRAAERALTEARTGLDGAAKERLRLQAELDAHTRRCAHAATTLETAVVRIVPEVADFLQQQAEDDPAVKPSAGDPGAIDALLAHLTRAAEQRTELTTRLTALDPILAALTAGLEQRARTMANEQHGLEADQQGLHESRTALDALTQERQLLFGEKHPEAEAVRLEQAVAAARAALQSSANAQDAAMQELSRQKALSEEAQRSVTAHTAALETEENTFCARLGPTPFGDEAAFLEARLPETERLSLETQEAALHAEQTRLDARDTDLRTLEARLHQEAQSLHGLPPERDPAEKARLLAALQELEQRRSAMDQEAGGLSLRLAEDADLRRSRVARLEIIARQQDVVARWSRLNALIGTKNGNVYRTFAQGLTFAALTDHANEQLRAMTDRYILLPHPDEPLSLAVADRYQAGEVRSAANLSGGETFMVSLALALGLSGMVSRKTGVESLFLDEGFGTLDPEALDMALNTLASLRHEGKLICVISHVPALQERMGLHIEVRAGNAGRSELTGPGVRAVPPVPEKSTRKTGKTKDAS